MSQLADARDFAQKVAKLAEDAKALREHPHVPRNEVTRLEIAEVMRAIKPLLRSATWRLASLELAALRTAQPKARSLTLHGGMT